MYLRGIFCALLFVSARSAVVRAEELGEDGFADSGGVKIHYVTAGEGPLVVMIHGFPDFWMTWRKQIDALDDVYRVAAMDQRGYNLSDKPAGVDAYAMPNLVADASGKASLKAITTRVTISDGPLSLFDADGSAVIVHGNADQGKTGEPKSGVSGGPRIACGVITK